MNDEFAKTDKQHPNGNGVTDYGELRRLLLAPEHQQLTDADERIRKLEERKSDVTVEEVSELLPEAVLRRSRKDPQLANALAPTVEKTLHVAVRRDPRPIVDALFPIIGPAIRKSIAEALSSTLESINQTMETRFSVQSLKWRLEARRSGRTFSEVALSHTLLYKIDQIFVIDHETSLPLVHVSSESAEVKDSAMVSGMLNVIQDFVRDSFGSDDDEMLEALEVGDVNVWFESGPRATLAAVISGNPPKSLRENLKELIEGFHLAHGEELLEFDGDVSPFASSIPLLREGLLEKHDDKPEKKSIFVWLALAVIAILIGWFLYQAIESENRRSKFIDLLNDKPGVVVTDHFKRNGMLYVTGLQDPMASNVRDAEVASGVDPERIVYRWEQYHTLAPDILAERARQLLTPPESVSLTAREGTVFATGVASNDWIESARQRAGFLTTAVTYNDYAVVNREDLAIAEAVENISSLWIGFPFGEAVIPSGETARLDQLVGEIARLSEAADIRGVPFTIVLSGGASGDPSLRSNQLLMNARSTVVKNELVARGVNPQWLQTEARSTPLESNPSLEGQARARSVELEVRLR